MALSGGFTESGLERRLADLNSSQQSIQNLSVWSCHHRKHHPLIVKIWHREFLKAHENRKLTFIYLANDVIQNSRRKGPEFGTSFMPVIKNTLKYMARIPGDKTKDSLLRILKIWNDRSIYEPPVIKQFEQDYLANWNSIHNKNEQEVVTILDDDDVVITDDLDVSEITSPVQSTSTSTSTPSKGKEASTSIPEKRKRHHHHHEKKSSRHSSSSSSRHSHEKRKLLKKDEISTSEQAPVPKETLRIPDLDTTGKVDEWQSEDGVLHLQVKLSPSPYKDPPTEDEIIHLIRELEKMPSTDATTRGKIANLPSEISDASRLDDICIDSDVSKVLLVKVKAAGELLVDYNEKLDKELEDRKSASMKFQDFATAQKDLLSQAEQRLEEHHNHSRIIGKMIEDLKEHIDSMPDFSLPTVTDGLKPLPSAENLFV